MNDFFDIRDRLRRQYVAPRPETAKAKGEAIGDGGFLTEVAGRVILTAPAATIGEASELPRELAERWEKAASGNPFMLWLQGRFVEAEKANRNGAYWSTEDLQFGEMSVKHGPLNWLHDETTVVGTIADNALIHPQADQQRQAASHSHTFTTTSANITLDPLRQLTTNTAGLLDQAMPRPYMAAVSAVWKWVHPEKAQLVEQAAGEGKLWYSMECIAREMSCASDETHQGCGQSFDYVTAMTQPHQTCEHIATRTSARRMVDPSFLGGAVILPPTQPGWGAASVELVRQAASLAEQTHAAAVDMKDAEWQSLMEQVVRYATS